MPENLIVGLTNFMVAVVVPGKRAGRLARCRHDRPDATACDTSGLVNSFRGTIYAE